MPDGSRPRLAGVVLDAPEPGELATFYERLLGWQRVTDEPEWVQLTPPEGGPTLSFQREPLFVPPRWPSRTDEQQMMVHLDIAVDDLEAVGEQVVEAGAVLADYQPQDHVRVYLDPVGHPFCLFL